MGKRCRIENSSVSNHLWPINLFFGAPSRCSADATTTWSHCSPAAKGSLGRCLWVLLVSWNPTRCLLKLLAPVQTFSKFCNVAAIETQASFWLTKMSSNRRGRSPSCRLSLPVSPHYPAALPRGSRRLLRAAAPPAGTASPLQRPIGSRRAARAAPTGAKAARGRASNGRNGRDGRSGSSGSVCFFRLRRDLQKTEGRLLILVTRCFFSRNAPVPLRAFFFIRFAFFFPSLRKALWLRGFTEGRAVVVSVAVPAGPFVGMGCVGPCVFVGMAANCRSLWACLTSRIQKRDLQ